MHILQSILTNLSYETRAYSGRGMGGKECLAVDLDDLTATGLWADLYEGAHLLRLDDIEDVAHNIRKSQQDSMGRGIVVYFPGVPFEVAP